MVLSEETPAFASSGVDQRISKEVSEEEPVQA